MNKDSVANRIYIGAPIEHESERKFLASTVRKLEDEHIPYVILANVQVGGRQIDCIIATARGVSVVEVKSSYLPVRGGLNGNWEQLQASGEWRPYANAYQQALGAKNALRDAMSAAKEVGGFYPDGYVVFTSNFAEGSELTNGDFKVAVVTFGQFLSNVKVERSAPWCLNEWKIFAGKLALRPISLAEAIATREHNAAAELVKQYNAAVAAEYGRDGTRWLPETPEERSDLLVAATKGAGCYVSGASGCGKTLMAKWFAADQADAGNPAFFFAAKDFTGSWADTVRREVALLCDQSASVLFRAISRVDKPVFLVLDGINELGSNGPSALRGIRALARRLGAKMIVTGQPKKPSELEGLRTVEVKRPSIELKQRIAQSAGMLSATGVEILKAINSGMEAEIVGQIGQDLKADATRLVLLDQYIRIRLGGHGRSASLGLRRLASALHEQVAYSVSEAEFDEFMLAQHVAFADSDALFDAGLLVKRGGRVSFSHEMIQNVCAAFDLARQAASDPGRFGHRLCTPILEGIAGDVVSAIEDASTCRAVLEAVTSPALLCAAAEGELGVIASSIARALLDEASDACAAEIRTAQLVFIKESGALRVDWAEESRRRWNEPERARLIAIGQRAKTATGLNVYLSLCAEMDKRLASERQRLAEAAREARFALKSQSFWLAYYGFGNQIGFTHVCRAGHHDFRDLFGEVPKKEVKLAEMSSGQLHFLLENRSTFFGYDEEGRFAEELIYLLRERFRWEPYHVQLAILYAVAFARNAPDETLARLVDAINGLEVSPANWGINSSVIDALKWLGAIDESDETRNQIRHELYSVLGDDEGNVDKDLALSLCVNMFDHPYDWIYGEEILQLDEALRRRLYRRAFGASGIKRSMSLGWLSRQIASFDDAGDAALLWPLASLPDPSNSFPQEEWAGFTVAARFLGRHGSGLPSIDGEMAADRCLADIRTLIYAAESGRPPDLENARRAWQRLHTMPAQLVIGCLSEVHAALIERHWDEGEEIRGPLNLMDVYPTDCLKVARRFVEDGVEAEFFHRVPWRERGRSFAFSVIGCHGDRSDLDRLRGLSRAHPFARYALTALKTLDDVSERSHHPASTI
jgi:hypothetical protein